MVIFLKKKLVKLEENLELLNIIVKDVERISFYLQELPIPNEAKKSFGRFKKSFYEVKKTYINGIHYLEQNLEEKSNLIGLILIKLSRITNFKNISKVSQSLVS